MTMQVFQQPHFPKSPVPNGKEDLNHQFEGSKPHSVMLYFVVFNPATNPCDSNDDKAW